jgi:tetratricopeptide (TPR) repeat protein
VATLPSLVAPGAQEHYQVGIELLRRGFPEDAFLRLSQAILADEKSPRVRSAYALSLALTRCEWGRAAELAEQAVEEEFYNPELHVTLGRIYLLSGKRGKAVDALRGALNVDPENRAALGELSRLERRRRPVIAFFGRDHPVNRALGRLRARLLGAPRRGPRSAVALAGRRPPR